jgi:hypothetical protein
VKQPFMMKKGKRVAVIRPSDPAKALELTQACIDSNDAARFAQLPNELQDAGVRYSFAGWASLHSARLLDEEGRDIGAMEAGDSMVSPEGIGHEA